MNTDGSSQHRISDVAERAYAFAAGLAAHGIRPGDVVAFQLPNCVEAGITFYGASLLGVILVPVVHFYGHKELGLLLLSAGFMAGIVTDLVVAWGGG